MPRKIEALRGKPRRIFETLEPRSKDPADIPPQALKEMIAKKELGVKTGKGFYTYPHPEYADPDFLKP